MTATLPDVLPRTGPNPAMLGVARSLLLDAAAAECISTLRAKGIRAILLKGPVTVRWLYSGHATRTYTDIDLLVAPEVFPRAVRALESLGYGDVLGYPDVVEDRREIEGEHSAPLTLERPSVAGATRFPAGVSVDLHWSFHGIGASDETFWTVVAEDAERMLLSGTEVDVPSEPARALLLALHAATFRASVGKPLRDLDRALERLPDDTWRAAERLAVRLDALPRYVAGLGMRPLGVKLIDRLQLKGSLDVRSALYAAGAPPVADSIERLATARGVGPRMRLLARGLIPPPASVRLWSRLARRGRFGLALAYAYRPFWLLAKLPAALRARAGARRAVEADRPRDPGSG